MTFKKLLSSFLTALAIFSLVTSTISANAADIKNNKSSHEIDVVFDNSGSMYDTDLWSRAKYAMEIFASMLDYETEDVLKVYPMWGVTTNGETSSSGSKNPIEIKKMSDIEKIHKMYTPEAYGTPYEPVNSAFNSLKNSTKNEKWLVILTDGDFSDKSKNDIISDLKSKSGNVNVEFIGMGSSAPSFSRDSSGNFNAVEVKTSTELTNTLTNTCNKIFKRNPLSSSHISGNKITLDVSTRKLIVFVQGNGCIINGLKTSEGSKVEEVANSRYSALPSNMSAGKGADVVYNNKATVASDLKGELVAFEPCKAGNYVLDYQGSDLQIFYEPDVDTQVTITNEDGSHTYTYEELEKGIEPGNYKVEYGIVDAQNGNDVMNSDMMGNTTLEAELTDQNGNERIFNSGDVINFQPNSQLTIKISGSYLDNYRIESSDDESSNFKINVNLPAEDKLETSIDGGLKSFSTSEKHSWKPFILHITKNGESLTDEELSKLSANISFSDNSPFTLKPLSGKSAFEIYYAQNSDGSYAEPNDGIVSLSTQVSLTDDYGRTVCSNTSKARFVVTWMPSWAVPLIVCLCFLILLLIILIIMTRKVLPKRIEFDKKSSKIILNSETNDLKPNQPKYRKTGLLFKKRGTFSIDMLYIQGCNVICSATFRVKAVDRLYKKSKNRRLQIESISSACDYIQINGIKYEKDSNGMFNVSKKCIISNAMITLVKTFDGDTLQLDYKIIRK